MKAVVIIDALRRAKAKLVVASIEDKPETVASRIVTHVADMVHDEVAKLSYDLIVLPCALGSAQAFADTQKLVKLLKKLSESNRKYGTMCAFPALVLKPQWIT